MTFRPLTNRPATLARREALLSAAVELVAERGVGAVTHRDVATRAGLPLSATSYFFASIDELVLEALRHFSAEFVERLDSVTAEIAQTKRSPEAAVDALLDVLLTAPEHHIVAQFEAYLEVTRRPELGVEVQQVLAALERLAATALVATGARASETGARAFVALLDGFALQRLAWPRPSSDRTALRAAILALHAAHATE